MSRIDENEAVDVTVTPTKVTVKAKGLLAIKAGFTGSFSLVYVVYVCWWLKVDLMPASLTYLLVVVVFYLVWAFCWNKTFRRTRRLRK